MSSCPDDMELQGEERQLLKARASAGVASKGGRKEAWRAFCSFNLNRAPGEQESDFKPSRLRRGALAATIFEAIHTRVCVPLENYFNFLLKNLVCSVMILTFDFIFKHLIWVRVLARAQALGTWVICFSAPTLFQPCHVTLGSLFTPTPAWNLLLGPTVEKARLNDASRVSILCPPAAWPEAAPFKPQTPGSEATPLTTRLGKSRLGRPVSSHLADRGQRPGPGGLRGPGDGWQGGGHTPRGDEVRGL